ISDLEVAPPGVELHAGSEPDSRELVAPAGTLVTMRYRVHETPTPPNDERRFRPFIAREYFEVFGNAALVLPGAGGETQRIELVWNGFPEDFVIANSFGQGERKQVFKATNGELFHAVYVGGDFRLRRFDVEERPVFVAIRGAYAFSDDQVVDMAKRVVTVER